MRLGALVRNGQQNLWREVQELQEYAYYGRFIDVRGYGAAGDGTSNDSAAIQAAIDSSGTGPVALYLPPLTFNLGTTGLTAPPEGLIIAGSGYDYNLQSGSILKYTGTGAAITLSSTNTEHPEHFALRDFAIDGTSSSTGGAYGIQFGTSTGGTSGTAAGPLNPTVALAGTGAGNVNNGAHRYLVTFVTAAGEGGRGVAGALVTVVDSSTDGRVSVTAIPTGSPAVTSRKLYRTTAGGSTYLLLTTLNDNTTTTYTDNTADGSLGAAAPAQAFVPANPTAFGLIQNVLTMRCSIAGLRFVYSTNVTLNHVTSRGNKLGLLCDNSTVEDNVTGCTLYGCRLDDNDQQGALIMGQVRELSFDNCTLIGNDYEGIRCQNPTAAWRGLILANGTRVEDSNQGGGRTPGYYGFYMDMGAYAINPLIMDSFYCDGGTGNKGMKFISATTVESFAYIRNTTGNPTTNDFSGKWRIAIENSSGQWASGWIGDDASIQHGYVLTSNGAGLLMDLIGSNDKLVVGSRTIHPAPCARVYHSANQSINDITLTALAFDSERFDTDTIHNTSSNNSRLTCVTAGKYQITGQVQWASNGVGERWIGVRLNGATYIATQRMNAATTSDMTITTLYDLAVNDYVELIVYQSSGGALNVLASANYSPEFSTVLVG